MQCIIRTQNFDPDFQALIGLLDEELRAINGDFQAAYAPHNVIGRIDTAVLAYVNDSPVGCGCFRAKDEQAVEIKRMYVRPEYRGKGVAASILSELERWASELSFRVAVLETGRKQPWAIRFYEKQQYAVTENFAPYVGMPNSVCMSKSLKPEHPEIAF